MKNSRLAKHKELYLHYSRDLDIEAGDLDKTQTSSFQSETRPTSYKIFPRLNFQPETTARLRTSQISPRRHRDLSKVHLETETSRPTQHPCITVMLTFTFELNFLPYDTAIVSYLIQFTYYTNQNF